MNDFPRPVDEWLAIMPGRELIRAMPNAVQVSTDQWFSHQWLNAFPVWRRSWK